jgi:transcriptional regulator with XRE-family HTH domain
MTSSEIAKLKDPEYRAAFVEAQMAVGLPFQIRALREKRGMSQETLAAKAEMLQPRISAIEKPGKSKLNLETLRRIARAFDVGLLVKFVPFSELIGWSDSFDSEEFEISDFKSEFPDTEAHLDSKHVRGTVIGVATGVGLRKPPLTSKCGTSVSAPVQTLKSLNYSGREAVTVTTTSRGGMESEFTMQQSPFGNTVVGIGVPVALLRPAIDPSMRTTGGGW